MQATCQRIVSSRYFDSFIIGLILLNGVIIGLETATIANSPVAGGGAEQSGRSQARAFGGSARATG